MTAQQLIAETFSCVQSGAASNLRRLSPRQFTWLRDLIEVEAGGTIGRGDMGSLVWTPPGPDKYVLTEDPRGEKHTLTRLGNISTSGAGNLF